MLDNEKIGKFIADKRKEAGYTQQQLADLLGITNKAVSKWETGEGLPDISLFPVLAEVLDVSVDELLQGERAKAVETEAAPHGQKDSTDSVALHRYQWERQMEKFKKRCLLALCVSLVGIVCFGVVWFENQDYYSFGIGFLAQVLSICLFIGAYWSLAFEEKAYLRLYPAERTGGKGLMIKFLCLLLIFWLIVPLLFADIFAMRLVPWVHSSWVDVLCFLAGFGVIVLFLLYRFRKS